MNIGKKGEEIAKNYLLNKKFSIIKQNYHSKFGEIDIICEDKEYIVFVEVKSKFYLSFSNLSGRVDYVKQQKFLKTVKIYLSENITEKQPRIDVIEVTIFKNKYKINHIDNAF
mgnify:CR=1 FL=1